MLKHISCMFVLVFTLISPVTIQADSQHQEVVEYLKQIGWSQRELEDYLHRQGQSINQDFSPKELLEMLGTPINESNIRALLRQYKLSRQELDQLLHQVGENVEEYEFIEDLNKAVSYYIEHAEDIAGLSNFLTYVGLADHEISKLYRHIQSLDPFLLKKDLETIGQQFVPSTERLETTSNVELFQILNDVLSVYQLTATYHINAPNHNGGFQHLNDKDQVKGESVRIELFNQAGGSVGDLQLSSDMLSPDFITQTSQQLLRIGETKHSLHQLTIEGTPKPRSNTSPYISLVYGLIVLIGSSVYYFISKSKVTRS